MGTSSSYGGSKGNNPLVPSWLGPAPSAPPAANPQQPADGGGSGDNANNPSPPVRPPVPPAATAVSFTPAKTSFSRFASSGGSDRRALSRAVSSYVGGSGGGSRQLARRMGSSRGAGARLFGALANIAATNNAAQTLRTLNLAHLVGRPIEEIFLGLADYVCPDAGTIDEGIARDAFIETIAELASIGLTDIDNITIDQVRAVFELYAAHAIEARLCNDIGTKAITLPPDARQAERVQAQLHDFILRGVSDALAGIPTPTSLTDQQIGGFVDNVYQQAFEILHQLGEESGGT